MDFQQQPVQLAVPQQPFPQPCESYFVESQDDEWFTSRRDARERAKQFARERQLLIAEDLSRLTCDEYQSDVLKHMEHMEVRRTSNPLMRPIH
jgi:hypothetical protein